MKKALKDVLTDLLFENHFPVPDIVVSEDPDYLDACDEITKLSFKLKKELTIEQYDTVDELLSLMELANGYQLLEYFHSGLVCGYILHDKAKDHPMKDEIVYLIR